MTRCSGCAQPLPADPGPIGERKWFQLGNGKVVCRACLAEAVVLAEQRDYNAAVARRLAELGR